MNCQSSPNKVWLNKEGCLTRVCRHNSRHLPDDIFKCIVLYENVWILVKISPKCVPKCLFNNIPALVSIMAWRRPGDKPLSEPMMVSLLTHICVARTQCLSCNILVCPARYLSKSRRHFRALLGCPVHEDGRSPPRCRASGRTWKAEELPVREGTHCDVIWASCRLKSSATVFKSLFRPTPRNIKSPHYWPFVTGIHQWPVNSPHKQPVSTSWCHRDS